MCFDGMSNDKTMLARPTDVCDYSVVNTGTEKLLSKFPPEELGFVHFVRHINFSTDLIDQTRMFTHLVSGASSNKF